MMDREFVLREFQTAAFHLHPDGLISLGGTTVPQTIALSDTRIADDAVVDKEAGEAGLFTVKTAAGRFEARYREGQWWARTDIPEVFAELCKVMPGSHEPLTPTARAFFFFVFRCIRNR